MKNLFFIISFCCLCVSCEKDDLLQIDSLPSQIKLRTSQNVTIISVNGTIEEQFFQFNLTPDGISATGLNTWTGSLVGNGHIHIFSSDVIDFNNGIEENVISKRWLFTSEGNLFFEEVGERLGEAVKVTSTVSGGTGIYKKATGQLILDGAHTEVGIQFTYSGSITLQN